MFANDTTVSRRSVLRGGLAVAAAGAAAPILSACGAAGTANASDTLRVAAAATATGITVNPLRPSPGIGVLVLAQLYDPLVQLRGATPVFRLAESVEPNADATVWTIRIRGGATFHDGRPVTAADAAYSLRTLYDPKASALVGAMAPYVDAPGITATDTRTVRVPLTRARGDFVESMLAALSTVFPADTTDFTRGNGSGPFRLVRTDATAVELTANTGYWDGPPSVTHLQLAQIDDENTRLSAVTTGQLDYAVGIGAVGAHSRAGDGRVTVHRGGPENANALMFVMNQSRPPFDNPDVRAALRLAADRQQLVDNTLFGLGSPGNDLVGQGLAGYAADLPVRTHDPEQAASLLARAGVDTVTLRAADLVPGLADAARTFAQQAAQAGLTVKLDTANAATYFADIPALRATPFQAFYAVNRPAAVHLALMTARNAPFNATGLGPDHQAALDAATATVDPTARAARFHEIQRQLHATGGDIVWGIAEQLDVSRPGVDGVTWSQSTPLFHRATVS